MFNTCWPWFSSINSSNHHIIKNIKAEDQKALIIERCLTGVFYTHPLFRKEKIYNNRVPEMVWIFSQWNHLICTSIYYCMGGRLRSCLILLIQNLLNVCACGYFLKTFPFLCQKIRQAKVTSSYCRYERFRRKSFMENHIIVFLPHCVYYDQEERIAFIFDHIFVSIE